MDFLHAYAAMGLLMAAYVAFCDPQPRSHGLAWDIAIYTTLGLFWPITWLIALCIYIRRF